MKVKDFFICKLDEFYIISKDSKCTFRIRIVWRRRNHISGSFSLKLKVNNCSYAKNK
jgi:hypothetical protein